MRRGQRNGPTSGKSVSATCAVTKRLRGPVVGQLVDTFTTKSVLSPDSALRARWLGVCGHNQPPSSCSTLIMVASAGSRLFSASMAATSSTRCRMTGGTTPRSCPAPSGPVGARAVASLWRSFSWRSPTGRRRFSCQPSSARGRCVWLPAADVIARRRVGDPEVARTASSRVRTDICDSNDRHYKAGSRGARLQRGMTTDRQVWSRRLANGDHSRRTLKVQALLQKSLAVATGTGAMKPAGLSRVIVDTTVQPKNITFPTCRRMMRDTPSSTRPRIGGGYPTAVWLH